MARKLQDDLNLTAFVDLFSTLVCFLLLTAVWVHLGALTTNVEKVTASDSSSPPPPDQKKKANLVVTIMPDRVEMAEDENIQKIPIAGGQIDMEKVLQILANWKTKYPDRNDLILNTENSIPYRHMIGTFDAMVGAGWPDVGVNTQ